MGGFMDNSTHFSGWTGWWDIGPQPFWLSYLCVASRVHFTSRLEMEKSSHVSVDVQKLDKSPGELPKKNHIWTRIYCNLPARALGKHHCYRFFGNSALKWCGVLLISIAQCHCSLPDGRHVPIIIFELDLEFLFTYSCKIHMPFPKNMDPNMCKNLCIYTL